MVSWNIQRGTNEDNAFGEFEVNPRINSLPAAEVPIKVDEYLATNVSYVWIVGRSRWVAMSTPATASNA